MTVNLFSDSGVSIPPGYPMDEGSLRHRRTRVNSSALSQLKALSRNSKQQIDIRLGLFTGTTYVCRVKLESSPNVYKAFYGEVIGKPESWVVVTARGERLSMRIWVNDEEYIVLPVEQDVYLIEQVNPQLPIFCGTGETATPRRSQSKRSQGKLAVPVGPTVISVLVLYDKSSEKRAGGLEPLRVHIDGIVEDLNAALRRSLPGTGTDVRFRLVNTRRFDGDLPDSNCKACDKLRVNKDVKKWRNEVAADLVSMLRNVSKTSCADCLDSPSGDRGAFVSAVQYNQSVTRHSFAHEIGHNLGCPHNILNADCKGINDAFKDKKKKIYWGYKWQKKSKKKKKWYGTLMAYTGGTRIAHFSNPDVKYEGTPTGKRDRNNAAAIAMTAAWVAAYRGLVPMNKNKLKVR
jgi:hypothetical protein